MSTINTIDGGEIREQVEDVFQAVFNIVRKFTEDTGIMSVDTDTIVIDYELLVKLDPSADKVAKIIRFLSNILRGIIEISPDPLHENMMINVDQCVIELERMARSINRRDESEFIHAVRQLHNATNHRV